MVWLNRGPQDGAQWSDYPNNDRRTENIVFSAYAAVATRVAVLVEGRWVCDEPKTGPLETFLPRYREWIGA